MLALIASAALIAYLLIPGALYRVVFSLFIPPRNFQRTRVDEVRYAVLAGLVPLLVVLFLVFKAGWTGLHPFQFPGDTVSQRRADYRTVFSGAYEGELFRKDPAQFWHALNHVLRRQARILSWYYLALALEAAGLGLAGLKLWWFFREPAAGLTGPRNIARRARQGFADRVLVPQISEWYLLLSTAAFPRDPPRQVQLDALLDGDRLYRGTVGSYFLEKDGGLSGIMITNALRFDRRRYLRDEATAATALEANDYWKAIPGAKLYLPSNRIINLNFRYEPVLPREAADLLERLLWRAGINGRITEYEA